MLIYLIVQQSLFSFLSSQTFNYGENENKVLEIKY